MKKFDYDKIEKDGINESFHLTHLWEPLKFEIKKGYRFVINNPVFHFFSFIVLTIGVILLGIIDVVFLGFKAVNKNKILKKQSFISVSNHIHNLDCTMIGLIYYPRKLYFPTIQRNFKIPFVRRLIRLLGAIPIPNKDLMKNFYSEINDILNKNKCVQMYPEGSIWPYYDKIRTFKHGAFKMSVDANVAIQPVRFILVEPKGIYKLYKRKKCIHAIVLDPIYPNNDMEYECRIEDLKKRVSDALKGVDY